MWSFLGSLLAIGFVVGFADGANRLDQLFAAWEEAQHGVQSLVVEYTLETKGGPFSSDEREKVEGTFRLIRTGTGEVFASDERSDKNAKGDKQERWTGLLHGGSVYLLNHDKKVALRFDPEAGDLRGFLQRYFNPFVLLLDRKGAAEKHNLEVVKQDEWYAYLSVKPKQVKRYGWFPDTFHEGRVVLMNKASEAVPKDMPRQLWYTDGARACTVEVKAWRLNTADPPKLEEFAKPEDRPGWQVEPPPSKK